MGGSFIGQVEFSSKEWLIVMLCTLPPWFPNAFPFRTSGDTCSVVLGMGPRNLYFSEISSDSYEWPYTLKLFVLVLYKSIRHPWKSYLKFPFVFQRSNKTQKLWYLTGSIFQVRVKNIRHVSPSFDPVTNLIAMSSYITACKSLAIIVNYKQTTTNPSYWQFKILWCHWVGRATRMWSNGMNKWMNWVCLRWRKKDSEKTW